MSIETWKDEFYPIPADDKRLRTRVACLEHSIRKWVGLRKANLKKHGCFASTRTLPNIEDKDGNCFYVSMSSCALCVRWGCEDGSRSSCPIVQALGFSCDSAEGFGTSLWDRWNWDSDPEPMIRALRKVLRAIKAELAAAKDRRPMNAQQARKGKA